MKEVPFAVAILLKELMEALKELEETMIWKLWIVHSLAAKQQREVHYANGTDHEGYAISCRSYQITIQKCDFNGHSKATPGKSQSIVFAQTNEANIAPIVHELIFNNNPKVQPLIVSSINAFVVSNCIFNNTPLRLNDAWNTTQVSFISCLFQHNTGDNGGAVSITPSSSARNARSLAENKCIFTTCQFINNTARQGGALYDDSSKQLVLDSCSFYDSKATENGGSIYSSVNTESLNCNFSQTSAPKGAAIYAQHEANIVITNITLDFTKVPGQTAIYVTGTNKSNVFIIAGNGCFISSGRKDDDNTPDFLDYESEGAIRFNGNMCFSESLEKSIKLPSGLHINQPTWFNCKTCSAPVPPSTWSPTYVPTPFSPTPIINTSATPLPPDESDVTSRSKSKLSAGAIAGIVIGIVVFIALIILLIIFLIRRKGETKPPQEDAVSQEVDSGTFSNEQENPLWSEDIGSNEKPMYSPSIDNPNFENNNLEDPFIKEFEEGF